MPDFPIPVTVLTGFLGSGSEATLHAINEKDTLTISLY